MQVCDLKKCTGCFACYNICPKNCISMRPDEYGQVKPVIDEAICIKCHACTKHCPVNSKIECVRPTKCYAAYQKDYTKRMKAASGGVAGLIAERTVREGGIVYGSIFNETYSVVVQRMTRNDEIEALYGSKYIQSYVNDAYKLVKNDLSDGKRVVFFGTPCQVAGLRSYLGKKYESLVSIDIVCHGVPTQDTFQRYLTMEGIKIEDVGFLSFREGNHFSLKVYDHTGDLMGDFGLKNSLYYNGFLEGYIYRENCYSCSYACSERCGDITLCDFWGLGNKVPFDGDTSEGINAVLINTDLGQIIWDEVKDACMYWERTVEEAIEGNNQLRHPTPQSRFSYRFHSLARDKGIAYALTHANEKKRMLIRTRKIIGKNRAIYSFVKMIPIVGKKLT